MITKKQEKINFHRNVSLKRKFVRAALTLMCVKFHKRPLYALPNYHTGRAVAPLFYDVRVEGHASGAYDNNKKKHAPIQGIADDNFFLASKNGQFARFL